MTSRDGHGHHQIHYVTAIVSHIGERPSMEDEWFLHHGRSGDLGISDVTGEQLFVGLFDGHSGTRAARYCKSNMFNHFKEAATGIVQQKKASTAEQHEPSKQTAKKRNKRNKQGGAGGRNGQITLRFEEVVSESFHNAFTGVDKSFYQFEQESVAEVKHKDDKKYSGSTALCIFVNGNRVSIANAGDCRALLYNGEKFEQLTEDHRLSNEVEKERVIQSGGWVNDMRVCGVLEVTRGIGDFDFKYKFSECYPEHTTDLFEHLVIPKPDVSHTSIVLSPSNESNSYPLNFLIAATDGLWDAMSNEQVVQSMTNALNHHIDRFLSGTETKQLSGGVLQSVFEEFMSDVKKSAYHSSNYMDNVCISLILALPCQDKENYLDKDQANCPYCQGTEHPTYHFHYSQKPSHRNKTAARKKKGKGNKGKGGNNKGKRKNNNGRK